MAVSVIVFVEDVARSLAFYEHVLGRSWITSTRTAPTAS
jgi:hypothetical protein